MTHDVSETRSKKESDSQVLSGIDFIISHFVNQSISQPIFPRTISALKSNNAQIEVLSRQQALDFFKESGYVDCKINAFPSFTEYKGVQRYPPNFLFIDLDNTNFKSRRALDLALSKTLHNIKDRLNGHPTVLWTGGGYHIYQPIESVILENIIEFSEFDNASIQFLRFGEKFLSNKKSDPSHNISFKSCLIRIPGSFNSKYEKDSIVKIIQKWNEDRPSIKLLLGNFHAYLVNQKAKQIKLIKKYEKRDGFQYSSNSAKINWIEILLQIPIGDYRKNAIALILSPYLVNIRKISYRECYFIIKDWLSKCNALRGLDTDFDNRIKYSLNTALRTQRLPMKFDTLKTKNPDLHKIISIIMSKPYKSK